MQALLWLESEDGPLESIGHLALAAACILFCLSAFGAGAGSTISRPSRTRGLLIALALCMFVLYGEEVSWGQRYFAFETPETWASMNYQGETNLHNMSFIQFAFDAKSIYLHASFLFLSLLPLLASRWPVARRWSDGCGVIVAPKSIAVAFAIVTVLYWLSGPLVHATYDFVLFHTYDEFVETGSEVLWMVYATYCCRWVVASHEAVLFRSRHKLLVALASGAMVAACVFQVQQFRSHVAFPSRNAVAGSYFVAAQTFLDDDPDRMLPLVVASLEKAILFGYTNPELPRLFVMNQLKLVKAEIERGEKHLAIERLNRALLYEGHEDLAPLFAEALLAQASLLLDEGAYHQAIDRATRCLNYDPNRHEAYRTRGIALVSIGKGREAEPDLIGSLSENPANDADLLLFLANALIAEGEIDLAEGHLNLLLQQMPNLAEAKRLLIDCKRHRYQGRVSPVQIGD